MRHYVGRALRVLLLALAALGLVPNVLFLVLMTVVFLMYRKAMGILDCLRMLAKPME
jgi:hypothetical protein